MKYTAVAKIGARRTWLIINEFGGLNREFDGTKRQADAVAKKLSARGLMSPLQEREAAEALAAKRRR